MNKTQSPIQIPGYTYGTSAVARSPLSEQDFNLLKQSVLFTDEDVRYLRLAGEALQDQIEEVLDVWYGFVAAHPHLVHYFSGADGKPNPEYLAAVRKRFGQWIRDTCAANYDRAWLDYQQEIGLRHSRAKKNQTDNVRSAADHIHLRYLIAFIYPITATIRPFLAKKGHSAEEIEKMHQAWFKSVVLQVALWNVPYAKEGAF
ncbi:MAG: protoglobin domain-containing protein [Gammaproteobacteria bacterium]